MPSKSPAQARLMKAVAHGWKKPGGGGPTRAVAREFVNADKRRGKVQSFQFGGVTGPGMYGGALSRYRQMQGGRKPMTNVPRKSTGLQYNPMRSGPKVQPRRIQHTTGGPGRPPTGALSQVHRQMLGQRGGAPTPPGRRVTPPPGKMPGGGHPFMGRRNPMTRAVNRQRPMTRSGFGATRHLR